MTLKSDRQLELDFDEVAPDPSSMIESMRAYGYTLPSAVADLIDNSITAGARNVWLQFEWDGNESWVSITDDGCGMNEDDLRDAMRLGSRSPLEERADADLGRFGLGLKTASLSQCRRLTVASKTANGIPVVRRWDLDHLAKKSIQGWQLLKTAAPGSESRLVLRAGTDQGTVVLWEILDRVVGDAKTEDETLHSHFRRLVEEVEQHLKMVFHQFLARQKDGLRIHVNENSISPWDPFLQSHPSTDRWPEEQIRMAGHRDPVRVKGFVLPHKDRLTNEEHRGASGPAGWNAQQGFYVYRNQRLIVPGSWLGLGGSRPWTKEEHFKLARIRVEIPTSMDHLWQLDVKKSSAHPPAQIREHLKNLAQNVRQKARAVYAHRGKYGHKTSKKELHRAWKARTRSGLLSYQIDRKHPLVEAVLQSVKGENLQFINSMLRVIEETVPVQQIWLDESEKPDSHAPPFSGLQSRELERLLNTCYRAFRTVRGLDHQSAIEALLELEEFSGEKARAAIAILMEEGQQQ